MSNERFKKESRKIKGKSVAPPAVVPDNPRIASMKPPDKPCTYDEWQAVIKANFPDLLFSAELCLSVISQILITDITNPFALVLVDVPSAGKTITLNFFAGIEQLSYPTDKFTPASFVSNAANVSKAKLAAVDLLPRVKNKVLIVRDLATIFSKREEDLKELLGILTRVLDGEGLRTESGVHGDRHYDGQYLLMFLAASTPVRPVVWKTMGNLGARLFFLNMNSKNMSIDELADQLGSTTAMDKEHVCREVTERIAQTLWAQNPDGVIWDSDRDDRELKKIIGQCAQLLACLRGVVNIDNEYGSNGKLETSNVTASVEKAWRINQLLYNLCRGHALACGRRQLNKDDVRVAIELAMDSAPTTRTILLRHLFENDGELLTKQVENLLNCTAPTAAKEMRIFKSLGLCNLIQESNGNVGEPPMKLSVKDDFRWFMSDECRAIRLLEPINKED